MADANHRASATSYRNGCRCDDCGAAEAERTRKYRVEHPERVSKRHALYYERHTTEAAARQRKAHLRHRYGLSLADYDSLLLKQGNRCAICGTSEPGGNGSNFVVDHDHSCCPGSNSCGRCIRGLLCFACNSGIGKLKDDPDLLTKAAAYLRAVRDGR